MTFEDADKIVRIWGKWEEYVYGRFKNIFMNCIPESSLPFTKNTLFEALNIMAEHYLQIGTEHAFELMNESVFMIHNEFVDDEKALIEMAKNINDPKWRESIITSTKRWQKAWITTQGDFDGYYC